MMDCSKCEKGGVYNTTVPFVVHENLRAQMSAANARLIRVIILLIVLLVGSNIAWLVYESQFEELSIEQEVDTGEGDAFVVGNGDLNYGEGQTESNETNP
jgi:hypothetical protein